MTIYSLMCEKCKKINCSKYYNCIHCDIVQCEECLDETNPKRLKCRLLKDNNCGVEKTIYCINHCTKTKKFCADCGKNYNFLRSCRKCKTFFCTDCRIRNTDNINHFLIEGEDNYNRNLLSLTTFYCSSACFEMDHIHDDEHQMVCYNCGELYKNSFNESECQRCLTRIRVDIDVDYNSKRVKLQNQINNLMSKGKIDLPIIKKKIDEYMETEIVNNSFMEKNTLTFNDWMTNSDEGSSKCFLMYDSCVIKLLKSFGVETEKRNFLFS